MRLLALALLLLLPIAGKTEFKLVRVYAIGLPSNGVLLQRDDYSKNKEGCLQFTTGESYDRVFYTVCGSYTIITEPGD